MQQNLTQFNNAGMHCVILIALAATVSQNVQGGATTASKIASQHINTAWFRICGSTKPHFLTTRCSAGMTWKTPINFSCVCVNGVFAFSASNCDQEVYLVIGRGECFSIQKSVTSIKFIGDYKDPFKPGSYLTTKYFDGFIPIKRYAVSPSFSIQGAYVLSINLTDDAIHRSDKLCLPPHPTIPSKSNSATAVRLYWNQRREPMDFKLTQDLKSCDSFTLYDHTVHFGQVFLEDKVSSPGSNACKLQCKMDPDQRTSGGRGMNKNPSLGRSLIGTRTEPSGRVRVDMETPIRRRREIREQTLNMLQTDIAFRLFNEIIPIVNAQEYSLFSMALKIFASIVPHDIVPVSLVFTVARMWRRLLWETQSLFVHSENTHTEAITRIYTALQYCFGNVSGYPMKFVNKYNVSSHGCLETTVATYWNDSEVPPPGEKRLILLSNSTMTKEMVFDLKKYDFIVEFAWKIFLFSHYHCTSWFDSNPLDHSRFAHIIMSLFNRGVMTRWYNPFDSLKALQLYLPNINFKDAAYATDRVTDAARDASQLQFWLQRPPVPTEDEIRLLTRKKRKSSVVFVNGIGNAYCLQLKDVKNFENFVC